MADAGTVVVKVQLDLSALAQSLRDAADVIELMALKRDAEE